MDLPRVLPPPGHEEDALLTVRPGPPPLEPVRCYSCGLQVSSRHAEFQARIRGGQAPSSALDAVGATRVCCRRMILSQPVFSDQLALISHSKEDPSVEPKESGLAGSVVPPGIGDPAKNGTP